MKLKATLTLVAASLFLAACDQSGSAAKYYTYNLVANLLLFY